MKFTSSSFPIVQNEMKLETSQFEQLHILMVVQECTELQHVNVSEHHHPCLVYFTIDLKIYTFHSVNCYISVVEEDEKISGN